MNKGECMYCKLEKPLFLHNIYHKNSYLRVCTACLLNIYKGNFCPFCFQVYENQEFSSSQNLVICYFCPAISHLSCVASSIASASTSTSTSIRHTRYICPSCSSPKFRFFNFQRDEKTKLVTIDKHLAQQLLAASIISQRSMKEAAILSKQQADIKAKEAVQARKEAKQALDRLAQLNSLVNMSCTIPILNNCIPSSSKSGENEN